jgi:hypothetical protein
MPATLSPILQLASIPLHRQIPLRAPAICVAGRGRDGQVTVPYHTQKAWVAQDQHGKHVCAARTANTNTPWDAPAWPTARACGPTTCARHVVRLEADAIALAGCQALVGRRSTRGERASRHQAGSMRICAGSAVACKQERQELRGRQWNLPWPGSTVVFKQERQEPGGRQWHLFWPR